METGMKTILVGAFCVIMISFMGCYTPHFLPNTAPTPMFDHAGNVRLAGYAGTNSYDVQVGVSPIEHIGIIGAGSVSNNKRVDNGSNNQLSDNDAEWTHFHRYFEGALGYYFSPFKLKNDVMKIEVFAGYGKGIANGSIDSGKKNFLGFTIPTTRVDADYKQNYLQINMAISSKTLNSDSTNLSEGIMEYGSIFRFSKTEYSNFRKNEQLLDVSSMDGNFVQFCVFGNIRGGGLGLTAQAGWLYPVGDDQNRPSYSPLYFTVGLRIDLW
jgi:hypothetical protein